MRTKTTKSAIKPPARLRVAFLCPGLGHVRRGFETGTARYFEALRKYGGEGIEARLFCGGHVRGGVRVPCVARGGRLARLLRGLGVLGDGARLEQITFGLSLIPRLCASPPDIIWLQEYSLGLLLLRLRTLPILRLRLRYRIVLCNGAPVGPGEYSRFDFVHHLHQAGFDEAIRTGLAPSVMEALPYCCPSPAADLDRGQVRASLGIPKNDWVVVSVAAWNRHHKRIDFLIQEVAALEDPRVWLVLCGQPEPDTPALRELAARKLGERILWLTLPPEKIFGVVAAADAFVLASLHEALGIVLIEAAQCAVPIVCHPHNGSKLVLGGYGEDSMHDLSQPGSLARRLRELQQSPPSREQLQHIRSRATERFSPQSIGPRLAALLHRALQTGSE